MPNTSVSDTPPGQSIFEASCSEDTAFATTQNADIMTSPKRGQPKRGPFLDATLRMETAELRKIGSCIRCKIQRIRCRSNPEDLSGECLPCSKLAGSSLRRFPCSRHKLTQLQLIKLPYVRGDTWARRWKSMVMEPIKASPSPLYRLLRISEGLSNKFIELRVRESTIESQSDGDWERYFGSIGVNESRSRTKGYTLIDPRAGEEAYANYVPKITGEALKRYAGPSQGLLHQTYRLACQVFQHPQTPVESAALLGVAFRLWTSVRLSTMPAYVVGKETLGLDRDIHEGFTGMVSVPPDLGAQLELTLLHYIEGTLRKDLMNRLQSMMYRYKKRTWLVIYLVTFMLLHSTTLLVGHTTNNAPGLGLKQPFGNTEIVKQVYFEAHTLLAHFHYCNRGFFPLSEDCTDRILTADVGLDDKTVQFIHYSRAFARQHKPRWDELKRLSSYEDDYFFISQMFEENWQPRSMSTGSESE